MGGESAELVNDVLEGNAGEGRGREGTGDKGNVVHCTARRQRGIGGGRCTRVPGEEGHASRCGKAYRSEVGDAIVFRRHVFGKVCCVCGQERAPPDLGSLVPEVRRTRRISYDHWSIVSTRGCAQGKNENGR